MVTLKKVLFVATVAGHFKVFHLPYMQWFKEQGWDVHIVTGNEMELPFCDKKYKIPITRSPYRFSNIIALKRLEKIINNEKYDIVHCHTPMGGVIGRLAARKARKHNTKVIYTAHGFHFFKGAPVINWLLYYPIEKFLSKYTDVLITINEEDYQRAKNFKAKRVEYIPGIGVDTSKFCNAVVDKDKKREDLSIPKDAFVAVSVGELNKNKNHQTAIKAIAKLNNSHIYYIICGRGANEKKLLGLAKKLGIDERIKLLGKRNDVLEILKASDLFIFPSLREGLSVALMEAMSAGPCR